MRRVLLASLVLLGLALALPVPADMQTKPAPSPAVNPVLVFDTAKGSFEIELFATEAPKSVEQILALMKKGFYRGQHFHRVTASLVQWGDLQSRDMSRRDYWGKGSSGASPIGVFELSKKRSHVRGAVGLAHSGNPAGASSQLYIMKTPSPGIDGQYAIIGRVTVGMAVVDKIEVADLIKNTSLR